MCIMIISLFAPPCSEDIKRQRRYTSTDGEVINYAQLTSTFLATLVINHSSMQRVWDNSWSVLKFPFYLNREDVQNGRYIDGVNLPLTSLDKEFDQFCLICIKNQRDATWQYVY